MKVRSGRGITLIETLVALAIISLISLPAISVYRSGMQNSVNGMIAQDMMNSGKQIISQIKDDLRHSAIGYQGGFSIAFQEMLSYAAPNSSGFDNQTFTLYRFPEKASYNDKAKGSMKLGMLTKITYRLEKLINTPFLRLSRQKMDSHGTVSNKILSDRINFFSIHPVEFKLEKDNSAWLFNISLQLGLYKGNSKRQPGHFLTDKENSLKIMEFYDVVSSDFFTAINTNRINTRNWNSGLKH